MADSAGKGSSSSSFNDDTEKNELLKKLALWQVQPLAPITTHKELEPILAGLGFYEGLLLPPNQVQGTGPWITYIFGANSRWINKFLKSDQKEPPIVKLPYPKFDGLHENTYTAFLQALNFYLEGDDDNLSSNIFTVKGMDLNESELQETNWRIEESEDQKLYIHKPTSNLESVELMKKLALWQVEPILKPITTHKELEPILAGLGFYPGLLLPPHQLHGTVSWMSYIYGANSRWMNKFVKTKELEPPSVKLPYPEFDGQHELAYTTFLQALNYYLERDDDNLSSIFTIKSMDVNASDLQVTNWKIAESEEKSYIYKPTNLDKAAVDLMIRKIFGDDDPVDKSDDDDSALPVWKIRRARSGSNSSSSTSTSGSDDVPPN